MDHNVSHGAWLVFLLQFASSKEYFSLESLAFLMEGGWKRYINKTWSLPSMNSQSSLRKRHIKKWFQILNVSKINMRHGFYNRSIVCCLWRDRTYLILPRLRVLSCFSFVWLFCDPMDQNLLGSSVHGILQARILERVAMPSSRASSWPRDQTHSSMSPALQVASLPLPPPRKPLLSLWVLSCSVAS